MGEAGHQHDRQMPPLYPHTFREFHTAERGHVRERKLERGISSMHRARRPRRLDVTRGQPVRSRSHRERGEDPQARGGLSHGGAHRGPNSAPSSPRILTRCSTAPACTPPLATCRPWRTNSSITSLAPRCGQIPDSLGGSLRDAVRAMLDRLHENPERSRTATSSSSPRWRWARRRAIDGVGTGHEWLHRALAAACGATEAGAAHRCGSGPRDAKAIGPLRGGAQYGDPRAGAGFRVRGHRRRSEAERGVGPRPATREGVARG